MSVLWQAPIQRLATSNMARFLAYAKRHTNNPEMVDYASLYAWSVQAPETFWALLWQFCDIRASKPWQQVLTPLKHLPGARWFVGSRLNFAENLLRFRDDRDALVFIGEQGQRRCYSYAQLYREVTRLAYGLRELGVQSGDRVAAFLPNIPEAIIGMLASASIGAIWSSCSPDFGAQGVLDRFGQIKPKVLFVTDGYQYNGKTLDSLVHLSQVLAEISSIEKTILIPFVNEQADLSGLPKACYYQDVLADNAPQNLEFAQLEFDHALYILYSSGTTGKPKCIMHGAGGTLIQHLKELVLHTDLTRDDRIFYFTTCGWMMWNWLVSSLAVGATLILYDGSPFYPNAMRLFDLAESEKMTVMGVSARYLAAVEKAGVKPKESHDLDALKTILSTGSPLLAESFDYVYRDIKTDVHLASISGGTDIISCFALGNPLLPVRRGELQCRGLGMAVEVFDEQGQSLTEGKGELVCSKPFPSMPIAFWNDPKQQKYHRAYFDKFPDIWAHGDYAELTEHGCLVIYGRSDAILNPGGVRIGTAEIYRQLEPLEEVMDSLVTGQQWRGDERIVLFVQLSDGVGLDQELVDKIKRKIRENTSPRHVPAKIIQVADIPRTRNNKLAELAVKAVIHGRPVANEEALVNPQALAHFKALSELETG